VNENKQINKAQIIKAVIIFLNLFISETLAKRIVSMILLAAGIPNSSITEITGLCDKSVRSLKKRIEAGEIDSLFHTGNAGSKGKLVNVEASIIEEINKNDYYSQQEIADMVHEKYGIKVSAVTIGRLLKKTASNA
jgi:transposase